MEFTKDFFEDEVRNGFYVPGIMKRCWAASLEILLEFDRICKKHDIAYYIDYGTLLGAKRNGGFIPWDDDIDISLNREDFNRLKEVILKEAPEELSFNSVDINGNYYSLPGLLRGQFGQSPFKQIPRVPLFVCHRYLYQ